MRVRVLPGRTVPGVASLWPGLGRGWRWPLERLPRPVLSRRQARVLRRGNALSSWGWTATAPWLSSGPAPRVLRPLPPSSRSPAPSVHVLVTDGENGLGWPQRQGWPGGPGGGPARTCPVPWPGRWPSAGLGGAWGPKAWRAVEPPRAPHPACAHVFPCGRAGTFGISPFTFLSRGRYSTVRHRSHFSRQLGGLSAFACRAAVAPPSSGLSSSQAETLSPKREPHPPRNVCSTWCL